MDVREIDVGNLDAQAGVAMLSGVEAHEASDEERTIDRSGDAIEVHGSLARDAVDGPDDDHAPGVGGGVGGAEEIDALGLAVGFHARELLGRGELVEAEEIGLGIHGLSAGGEAWGVLAHPGHDGGTVLAPGEGRGLAGGGAGNRGGQAPVAEDEGTLVAIHGARVYQRWGADVGRVPTRDSRAQNDRRDRFVVGSAFGTAPQDAADEDDAVDEELDGVLVDFRERPWCESGTIDAGSWESCDRDMGQEPIGHSVGAGETVGEATVDLENRSMRGEFEGEDAGHALWRKDHRRRDAEDARRKPGDRSFDGLDDVGKESVGGVADEEERQVNLLEWRGAGVLVAAGTRDEIEHSLGHPNWR